MTYLLFNFNKEEDDITFQNKLRLGRPLELFIRAERRLLRYATTNTKIPFCASDTVQIRQGFMPYYLLQNP
jgi:hypothetical protein